MSSITTTGGSRNLGEYKILEDKKGGEHNKFFLISTESTNIIHIKFFFLKGGTEDFHEKSFWNLMAFACIEICSKILLPKHLDYYECHFTTKNAQYFL